MVFDTPYHPFSTYWKSQVCFFLGGWGWFRFGRSCCTNLNSFCRVINIIPWLLQRHVTYSEATTEANPSTFVGDVSKLAVDGLSKPPPPWDRQGSLKYHFGGRSNNQQMVLVVFEKGCPSNKCSKCMRSGLVSFFITPERIPVDEFSLKKFQPKIYHQQKHINQVIQFVTKLYPQTLGWSRIHFQALPVTVLK